MRSLKDLANWYFSRAALPYWSILILDCIFVVFAGVLAYTVHHGSDQALGVLFPLACTVLIFLLSFLIAFRIFHTYNGVIRYSTFSDLLRILSAVCLAVVLGAVVLLCLEPKPWLVSFTVADVILMALFVVAFMWTVRVWVKTIFEQTFKRKNSNKAYILGVKTGGVALAKSIRSATDSPYNLAGFVSAEADMDHRILMGLKVFPFNHHLPELMKRNKVKYLIVSPLMMDDLRSNEELVNNMVEKGIKIMVMPQVREWDGKSNLELSDLHPVNVEDLLPRDKIEVDMQAAADLIHEHVVMITGAAGSIGSEMVRQIATYGP
ncbi:MAG: polysaccharide biosynthesis protein, partial [Muribaculaceae bacterium]|nr:polysaccharide biosynthesis protein [Muribaculaceae bacterium]